MCFSDWSEITFQYYRKFEYLKSFKIQIFDWKFEKSVMYPFSIIHPRCIKEVFSDATVFIADFGLFLYHISSDSNPGMTLEEPRRLRDRDVLRSCLYQSKEILIKAVLRDICPLVNSQCKQGIPHSSAIYNTIFTSSGFDWILPESVTEVRCYF